MCFVCFFSPTTPKKHTPTGASYLLGYVPCHVHMAFKFVHPDFSHPEGVPAHMGGEVLGVGLVGSLNVGNPRAGQDLYAPATLPHLRKTRAMRQCPDLTLKPRPQVTINASSDTSSSPHLTLLSAKGVSCTLFLLLEQEGY